MGKKTAYKIYSQQRMIALRKNVLNQRRIARDENPCQLRWINTMAKMLARCSSEQGWRAQFNGRNVATRNLDGWNVLQALAGPSRTSTRLCGY
jgi:hypothetical protein